MLNKNNPAYDKIDDHLKESIINFYLDAVPTGSFLKAVLSNDLVGAVGRADRRNIKVLKTIVSFVYNEIPGECWGNKKIVENWTGADEQIKEYYKENGKL